MKRLKTFWKKAAVMSLLAALIMVMLTPKAALASDPLTNYLTDWPQMTDISEQSAVLMDADNGGILYSLDRDVKRYPASITKILTCLLAIENTNMTDEVTIGEEAMEVAIEGNSNINPVLGETFTVEQCLYMLMLKSANDIAVQLAIQVAGSVEAFADMMNERAASLGCTGTHFTNPNGLPDENHYTTANDMALIMRECLKNDTFRQIIATTVYTVPATNMTPESRTYDNHNRLIDTSSEFYYSYCIGGKTGYIDAAGRTLICAAEKDGRTLIGVTMMGESQQDFVDMVSLFEYGFNNFTKTSETESEGVTLSYNLPSGVAASLSEETGTSAEEGYQVQNLIYDGRLKVGEKVTDLAAVEAAADEAAADVSDSTASVTASEETGTENPVTEAKDTTQSTRRLRRDIIAAFILALVSLAVMVFMIHILRKEKKRREELRRRREAKRRRMERERRREERRRKYEE